MKFHKDEKSSMREFREAYQYAKRKAEKRRRKARMDKMIADVEMAENKYFNLI